MKLKYDVLEGKVDLQTCLQQSTRLLDITAKMAIERQDTNLLMDIAANYVLLGQVSEGHSPEELMESKSDKPYGFASATGTFEIADMDEEVCDEDDGIDED